MAKRTFAVLSLALVTLGSGQQSRAQIDRIAVDGCGRLARVVYEEVYAAAKYGPGNSGPWVINIGQGDLVVCEHVARTVSRAFTSAMLGAGISVSWSGSRGFPGQSGDFCQSRYISQCYPDSFSRSTSKIGAETSLVQESWAVVLKSVMDEMYNQFSSDEVRFRDNDLKLRLGLSLRSIVVDS